MIFTLHSYLMKTETEKRCIEILDIVFKCIIHEGHLVSTINWSNDIVCANYVVELFVGMITCKVMFINNEASVWFECCMGIIHNFAGFVDDNSYWNMVHI